MTLIEIVVAIAIITTGVFGLLAGLAADLKQQHTEKLQTNAVRLATSELESARGLSYSSLLTLLGTTTTTKTVDGVDYTRTTNVQLCSADDGPDTCTTPAAGQPENARATVTVAWSVNGSSHSLTMTRNIADNSTATVTNGTSPLGSCGGSGTTLVTGQLTLSPSSVTVDGSGHPTQSVTATLTETGLSNATCVPLTWSDDNGAHQVTMTGSGGTFSVTIPTSSITEQSDGSISFTATVPGSQAVPSAVLSFTGRPSFTGNCTISVAGLALSTIKLTPLTRNSMLATGLSCTAKNLSKTDTVVAAYASGSGGSTRTVTLSSSDGKTWTGTIPAGSAMVSSGSSEAITFSLTRASDGATANISQTATLI